MSARLWHVVVLREEVCGEGGSTEAVERALRQAAPPDVLLWIPTLPTDRRSPYAQYVFLHPSVPPAVRRLKIVERVLREQVDEQELCRSLDAVAPLSVGDRVRGLPGPYKGIEGEVMALTKTTCHVGVDLVSGLKVVEVPRTHIEVV